MTSDPITRIVQTAAEEALESLFANGISAESIPPQLTEEIKAVMRPYVAASTPVSLEEGGQCEA